MANNSQPVDATVMDLLSDVERRRALRRRSLVTFWLTTILGAGIGAAVGATVSAPWQGVVLGGVTGAVLGTAACTLLAVWPVLRAVWHWLPEIGIVSASVGGLTALAGLTGSWWWSTIPAVLTGAGAAMRPVRRRVVAWAWCAIVRHRLRMCFAAFIRARNRLDPGLSPLILLARPTPAGERVWVWLRAGLDVAELENRTGKIAVACWASDVQVSASRRFAALVRIDVTRRDPLRRMVVSPLAAMVPGQRLHPVEPVDLAGLALDLDDVPATPALERTGRR